MRIVLVGNLPDPETIEIDEHTDFGTFEMIAGSYVNIDPENLVIKKDGRIIKGQPTALICDLGICNGDVLLTSKKMQPTTSSRSGNSNLLDFSGIDPSILSRSRGNQNQVKISPSIEQARQQFINLPPALLNQFKSYNPTLFDNLNDPIKFQQVFEEHQRMIASNSRELNDLQNADLMDPNVQGRIEELIKKNNIDSQMEHAIEHNPESFAQTTMLYINCKINGFNAKAFVDSGAQMTFISLKFAKLCHVDHLIDIRWKGVARGVGTQHIVGRVHCIQMQIAGVFLQMSVSVLENQEMDILIGLDMLKRYQCIINLKRNVLEIGSVNVETPFLPESELPDYAKLINL